MQVIESIYLPWTNRRQKCPTVITDIAFTFPNPDGIYACNAPTTIHKRLSRKSVNARGFVKSCLCCLIIAFIIIIILFLRLLNFEQFDSDLTISHRKVIHEICHSNFFLLIHSTNHWLRVVGNPEPWNNCQKIQIFWNWNVYWTCWQIKTMKLNINLHIPVKSFRISKFFEFFYWQLCSLIWFFFPEVVLALLGSMFWVIILL